MYGKNILPGEGKTSFFLVQDKYNLSTNKTSKQLTKLSILSGSWSQKFNSEDVIELLDPHNNEHTVRESMKMHEELRVEKIIKMHEHSAAEDFDITEDVPLKKFVIINNLTD